MGSFKYKLQSFLKSQGITQKHLSKQLGVTEVTVSNWRNGKSTPTAPMEIKFDNVIQSYLRYPDYYSWCCNAIAEGVFTCKDNSAMKEGTCTKCWKFDYVSEKKENTNGS